MPSWKEWKRLHSGLRQLVVDLYYMFVIVYCVIDFYTLHAVNLKYPWILEVNISPVNVDIFAVWKISLMLRRLSKIFIVRKHFHMR